MTPEDMKEIQDALYRALAIPNEDRTDWLDKNISKSDLRREIDALLQQSEIREEAQPLEPGSRSNKDTVAATSENGKELRADVPTHTDEPAVRTDLLGRRAMARFLAEDLRRIRSENSSSYVLHLHGPWGSGKSSLLNFIKDELENPSGLLERNSDKSRWVVIEFNVWRHERFGSPWWWMMEALASQAPQCLRKLGHPWRALRLSLAHWKWKNLTGLGFRVAFIGSLAAITLWVSNEIGKWFTTVDTVAAAGAVAFVSKALAAGGVLVGAANWLITNSARRSARAIGRLVELSDNPANYLKAHFERLVKLSRLPILILLDDVDRCRSDHVVELLEGIQIIFRYSPIIFIVAADRRWLHASYNQVYENYSGHLSEGDTELGQLFLEKILQASVPVPILDSASRDRFFSKLIGSALRPDEEADYRRVAQTSLRKINSERQLLEEIDRHKNEPGLQRILVEEALAHLATPKIAEQTKHALAGFAKLLEANPRAMKRFVNAYRINRALDLLMLRSTPPEVLARWTIVALRWPMLIRALANEPGLLGRLLDGTASLGQDADKFWNLRKLFDRPEVRATFGVDEGGTPVLDEAAVSRLARGLFPYVR